MVKELDNKIVIREFELHTHYYVRFQAHTSGKGIEPIHPSPNYGLKPSLTMVL